MGQARLAHRVTDKLRDRFLREDEALDNEADVSTHMVPSIALLFHRDTTSFDQRWAEKRSECVLWPSRSSGTISNV